MGKTLEQKQEIAKGLTGEKLLDAYDMYSKGFDPFNDDKCESFKVLRDEILRRCSREV